MTGTNVPGSSSRTPIWWVFPFVSTVGKKVTEGTVEMVRRSTRQMEDASISAITDYFGKNLRSAR